MDKSINIIIEDLRNDLLHVIGSYPLPIAITNIIVQDIAKTLAETTRLAIEKDRQIYEEGLKEEIAQG